MSSSPFQAGEGKWGTDEEMFNLIFAKRSFPHLREVFREYKVVAGKDIEDSIKSEFSCNAAKAFLAIGTLCFLTCYHYRQTCTARPLFIRTYLHIKTKTYKTPAY